MRMVGHIEDYEAHYAAQQIETISSRVDGPKYPQSDYPFTAMWVRPQLPLSRALQSCKATCNNAGWPEDLLSEAGREIEDTKHL